MKTRIGLCVFVVLLLIGCAPSDNGPGSLLELVGKIKTEGGEEYGTYNVWITGAFKNKSKKTLTMVGISFPICNKHGEKISDAADMTSGLQPGQTWRFKAQIVESDWAMCSDAKPAMTAF